MLNAFSHGLDRKQTSSLREALRRATSGLIVRDPSPSDDNPTVPRTPPAPQPAPYWLYLLECEGGVYYAGIALDVEERFFRHVFGLGARFTRARPPARVLAAREYPNKGDALRAELRLKALPRAEKLAFFDDMPRSDVAPVRERRGS